MNFLSPRNRRHGDKPHLLYISPVVPSLGGNGLAMRAAANLQILVRRYDITLKIIALYPPFDTAVPAPLAALCRAVEVSFPSDPHPSPGPSGPWLTRLTHRCAFDAVHVFRLSMLRYAQPYLSGRNSVPWRQIDLDEVESETHRSLADLYRLHAADDAAQREEAAGLQIRALEDQVLKDFDRVFVCSGRDSRTLQQRSGREVLVLPNVIRIPDYIPPPCRSTPFTFLFVGTLGYFPNLDGILYFRDQIMPLIRSGTSLPFRLYVVGTGGGRHLSRLVGGTGIEVIGQVPDVFPWYAAAGAAIVPLRAGGGTRIKILEAFSYRRPVVSTPLGAAGIEVNDGRHLLLASTPSQFAKHCISLMTDVHLAEMLADSAFSLVTERYTAGAVGRSSI